MRKFETATEYRRDLNKRRMAAGLCVRCGKSVDDDCTTCSICRRYKNQYVKQNKERKKVEKLPQKGLCRGSAIKIRNPAFPGGNFTG